MLGTGHGSFIQIRYCADCNMVKCPLVHSGGGVKVVVSAGVSKNGPGTVCVEEEIVVRTGVVDLVVMVLRTRFAKPLEV